MISLNKKSFEIRLLFEGNWYLAHYIHAIFMNFQELFLYATIFLLFVYEILYRLDYEIMIKDLCYSLHAEKRNISSKCTYFIKYLTYLHSNYTVSSHLCFVNVLETGVKFGKKLCMIEKKWIYLKKTFIYT